MVLNLGKNVIHHIFIFSKIFSKNIFLTKFDKTHDLVKFGQIWSNFVKFGQNWSKLIKMNLNCILKFFPEIFWKFVEILGERTQVTFFLPFVKAGCAGKHWHIILKLLAWLDFGPR